jgi:hypothetical protein
VRTQEARELGGQVAALVQAGQITEAYALLAPVLAGRTTFDLLRRIGVPAGIGSLDQVDAFLEVIATDKTEGGWVVIASALEARLDSDLTGAFVRCRDFIISADVWYAADIMGEGVVGQALVSHFQPAFELLAPWREDANPWVRRAVGTAVHFWAKRSRGAAEYTARAVALLTLLEPLFEEWEWTP